MRRWLNILYNNSTVLFLFKLMIDLHCHSFFSDGFLSPEQLLAKAVDAGVRVLALTDHDTIAGLASLHTAAKGLPMQVVNGIEFSVRWKMHDIHIIGLQMNLEDNSFLESIHEQEQRRIERAQQIGACLAKIGVQDAYQKACDYAGHTKVGRPHFGHILVGEGFALDMKQAFQRYLIRGKSAYVPTAWLSLDVIVDTIVQAGGQAVIAHPLKYNLTRSKLHALITAFKHAGGVGLEVVSGQMTVPQVMEMAGLCCRFELLGSTGSDYHGDSVSRIGLGRQLALPDCCTPIWQRWATH